LPLDNSLQPARPAQSQVLAHTRVLGFSLLRASTGQRLLLVAAMLVVLWMAVAWALQ
jgi:hypothetical protein